MAKSISWSDVKAKLADVDRAGMLSLVQALYGASKDNQVFLHARLSLGDDVLEPYKDTIDRWLWPDVFKNQDTSVAKAKKAITDYKKAIGLPEGMVELTVFYCECAAGFSVDIGLQDEGYFDSLLRMFAQGLKAAHTLGVEQRGDFLARLDGVRADCHSLGYGVGDQMDEMLAEFGVNERP